MPRIRVGRFAAGSRRAIRGITGYDKNVGPVPEKEDQAARQKSFAATARGVSIEVAMDRAYCSEDYPDGFRWVQTVTTNDPSWTAVGAPLKSPPVTYVDPKPNDDTKPFYWTDTEFVAKKANFDDTPGRPAHPTDTIVWDAVLSLVAVNGKKLKRFDSLAYGFSRDKSGAVTTRAPGKATSLASHTSAFASDFPGWTYS